VCSSDLRSRSALHLPGDARADVAATAGGLRQGSAERDLQPTPATGSAHETGGEAA